jgi:hypothetical protein
MKEEKINNRSAEIKDLFSSNKKKNHQAEKPRRLRIILFSITIIIILIILYFLYLNFRFTITDDLIIELPFRQTSLIATSQEPANLDIKAHVETSFFCGASCSHKLVSLSSNRTIFDENFSFKRFHKIHLDEELYPEILGEGHDFYIYSISCINVPMPNCPAKYDLIEKSAIIDVERVLTDKEIDQKLVQENFLKYIYSIHNYASGKLDESEYIIARIENAKKDDLETKYFDALISQQNFFNALNNVLDAQDTYNYSFVQSEIIKQNLHIITDEFKSEVDSLYLQIHNRLSAHNSTINKIYLLEKNISNANQTLDSSKYYLESFPDGLFFLESELNDANSLLRYSVNKMKKKDFNSYSEIDLNLQSGEAALSSFQEYYKSAMINNSEFLQTKISLFLMHEEICLIMNNSSVICHLNSTTLLNDSEKNYESLSLEANNICTNYSAITTKKNEISQNALSTRMNLSNSELIQIDINAQKNRIINLNKHIMNINKTNYSQTTVAESFMHQLLNKLEDESSALEKIRNEMNLSENQTQIESNMTLAIPHDFSLPIIENCKLIVNHTQNKEILDLQYEEIVPPNSSDFMTKYNETLRTQKPRICFMGKCNSQNADSSSNYPIIIVHGHSFYTKNYKVTPSQVHNEFLSSLFSDLSYIPAGILNENEPIKTNRLGLVNASFVYKATYYPEDIKQNESINLFAERLNKIILKAKEETGKEKVIIIAHSMGGLVTRAYMKKYGTNDLDYVIIAGTPNYGVPIDTVPICKFFGRNLECDEMFKESDFLKQLSSEPDYNIPIYTLRGEGCTTFGEIGDGVVQSSSVPLQYAVNYVFNGTCLPRGEYHINLLNPMQNPEIYSKIKEIILQHKK